MHARVTFDAMLEAMKKKHSEQEDEDDALVKSINFQSSRNCVQKRIHSDEDIPSRIWQKISDQNHPAPTTTESNLVRFVRSKPV